MDTKFGCSKCRYSTRGCARCRARTKNNSAQERAAALSTENVKPTKRKRCQETAASDADSAGAGHDTPRRKGAMKLHEGHDRCHAHVAATCGDPMPCAATAEATAVHDQAVDMLAAPSLVAVQPGPSAVRHAQDHVHAPPAQPSPTERKAMFMQQLHLRMQRRKQPALEEAAPNVEGAALKAAAMLDAAAVAATSDGSQDGSGPAASQLAAQAQRQVQQQQVSAGSSQQVGPVGTYPAAITPPSSVCLSLLGHAPVSSSPAVPTDNDQAADMADSPLHVQAAAAIGAALVPAPSPAAAAAMAAATGVPALSKVDQPVLTGHDGQAAAGAAEKAAASGAVSSEDTAQRRAAGIQRLLATGTPKSKPRPLPLNRGKRPAPPSNLGSPQGPAGSCGSFGGSPAAAHVNPRISLWVPPASPFSLLEEVGYSLILCSVVLICLWHNLVQCWVALMARPHTVLTSGL